MTDVGDGSQPAKSVDRSEHRLDVFPDARHVQMKEKFCVEFTWPLSCVRRLTRIGTNVAYLGLITLRKSGTRHEMRYSCRRLRHATE